MGGNLSDLSLYPHDKRVSSLEYIQPCCKDEFNHKWAIWRIGEKNLSEHKNAMTTAANVELLTATMYNSKYLIFKLMVDISLQQWIGWRNEKKIRYSVKETIYQKQNWEVSNLSTFSLS